MPKYKIWVKRKDTHQKITDENIWVGNTPNDGKSQITSGASRGAEWSYVEFDSWDAVLAAVGGGGEAKYIRVSTDSLTIQSAANSTGQFTISTNVSRVNISVSDTTNFSVQPTTGANGTQVTVKALNANTGISERTTTVTLVDNAGEADGTQVTVKQSAGGSPTPTDVNVTVYGNLEQMYGESPTYGELRIEAESDDIEFNGDTMLNAIYTVYDSPSSYGAPRRLGAKSRTIISEEDVTDKCTWEKDGDVYVSEGYVENWNKTTDDETATVTATYEEAPQPARKTLVLKGGNDGETWGVSIEPDVTEIQNGGEQQYEIYLVAYQGSNRIWHENVSNKIGVSWDIEEGRSYAGVLLGNVTNYNKGGDDQPVKLGGVYRQYSTTKNLTMKGTGSSGPFLSIRVTDGIPLRYTGGTVTLSVESNLDSWNISVRSLTDGISADWFDVGSPTGGRSEDRAVTVDWWSTTYNKTVREVEVTVTGGDGLSSSVVVQQMCSANPSLSPVRSTFPGPDGGVANLYVSIGGNITCHWRILAGNSASGWSFEENEVVREKMGVCTPEERYVLVPVYIDKSEWSTQKYISFYCEYYDVGEKKSGTVIQYSGILRLADGVDVSFLQDMESDDTSTHSLGIYTNAAWSVSATQSWIHVGKNQDGDAITVYLDKNTGDERTGKINVWATNFPNDGKFEINVKQKKESSSGPELSIICTDGTEMGPGGGTKHFEVYSNTGWTLTVEPEADWVEWRGTTSDTGNSTPYDNMTLFVDRNYGAKRTVVVSVKYTGQDEVKDRVTITQNSWYVECDCNYEYSGGTGDFEIICNDEYEWEAMTEETWIHFNTTSGVGSCSQEIRIDEYKNPDEDRQGTITVNEKSGKYSSTITINQTRDIPYLSFKASSLSVFNSSGGSRDITILSNTGFTLTSDCENWWLHVVNGDVEGPGGGSVREYKVTIEADPNPEGEAYRRCSLRLYDKDENEVANLSQGQNPYPN